MAKDARTLREEAAQATASGKLKRALAAYLELERLEPRDAQWAKRAGETYRRLGNNKNAIEAFNRSVERYAQNGFLVQAIAVCKIILQIDPNHQDTLRRLSMMNEQIGASPTRAANMAENNPALHENPHVAAIRRASSISNPPQSTIPPRAVPATYAPQPAVPRTITPRRKDSDELELIDELNNPRSRNSTSPVIAVSRTKSRPISLGPDAALDTITLSKEVPSARQRDDGEPGIHVIPLDDGVPTEDASDEDTNPRDLMDQDTGLPLIVVTDDDEQQVDESTELELADLEEIPLPAPRAIGLAAQRALSNTPLFAGLPSDVMKALVEHLTIVSLEPGQHLFREGDRSDALYVVVEGELSVQAEGPPRVEMGRLGPGSFIGEVALMTDQPRSATVTSLTGAELLRIDRTTLARVLGFHGDMLRAVLRFVRDRLVDRWMRTSPLFRPFDDQQRTELARRFSFLEIDAGTTLLGVGDRPDGLYIVLAGSFVVVREGQTVAQLTPGDLIGETALLSGGAFRSDVVANGKSLALCLPADDFREIIMTHPHILEYIGQQAEHSRRLHIL
ncbi:MAG TPA: cyclic nucleotide-binding domain-containing protein [Kofleriaceae bacterium]|nr:cyclic nucleotide-binding domain-containing protein [Kofleriaceae bacterium]